MAQGIHSDLYRVHKLAKDMQGLKRRFHRLETQVNARTATEDKEEDQQLMLDMKKFHFMLKTYKNAYYLTQNGTNCIVNMDAIKQAKKYKPTSADLRLDVVDPDDLDETYMYAERLSPPLSPSTAPHRPAAPIPDLPNPFEVSISKLKRKEMDDAALAGQNGARKRVRRDKDGKKKGGKATADGKIPPDTIVAARIAGGSKRDPTWILCSVIRHLPEKDKYELRDEDAADDDPSAKTYKVSAKNVNQLNGDLQFDKGQPVFAMFPDTTSFYPATVVRKQGDFVSVKFADDENESGRTPSRKVESRYVFPLDAKTS